MFAQLAARMPLYDARIGTAGRWELEFYFFSTLFALLHPIYCSLAGDPCFVLAQPPLPARAMP